MKKIVFLLGVLFLSLAAQAQSVENVDSVAVEKTVYQFVEQQPSFPGGMSAMMKYLQGNIKYPEDAKSKKQEGRAFVRFIVEEYGSITNAKIQKSSGNESLDKEAIRVVEAMPKWEPGKQNGKSVRVYFTLPINFRLK